MRSRSVLLVLVVGVATLSAPHAEAALPVANLSCGDDISSSVRLGRNITNCAQPEVLTITASNVTLDLNDVRVDGTSGCATVIAVAPGLTNVRVKGPGHVRGCPTGIGLGTGVNASKVKGVTITGTSTNAIALTSAPDNVITGNAIAHNIGTVTVSLVGSNDVRILNNDIAANLGNAAIRTDANSHRLLISGNRIVGNNGTAVEINDNGSDPVLTVVAENSIRFNDSDGVDSSGPVVIRDNRIVENDSNPILVVDDSRILRNFVARNSGFNVLGNDANIVKGNTFVGNDSGLDLGDNNEIVDNVSKNSAGGNVTIVGGNTVTGNVLTGATAGGGVLVDGDANTITGNQISNNFGNGITNTSNGVNNVITNNRIVGNVGDGINLQAGVTAATIKGNTTNENGFNNGVADGVGYGIRTPDVAGIGVDGSNTAKGNDVVDPDVQCNPDRLCA